MVSLPGASADSLARSDPDRTFFRSVARIAHQVAEALEFANRQGILHRDVKPSNLLLDPKGNVWVADFGLAKASDTEDLTHSGDIIGTVRYMAPERFRGKCDARSDVYALGLTLYELLALRPAFAAADRHELMRRVMSEEPERLRALVPHLPRDLETIVHTAIDREPGRRYATAAALAEDLQRFLDDKPIKARQVTTTEQAWRWAKRNPAVASLGAGLALALVASLAGVTWQWRKAAANLSAAEAANRKAQVRFDLAMQAVRAFTTGASEDVILKEKALEGLRKKLLGQSRLFYEKLTASLAGETDRASRSALAEALFDAGTLYAKVDAPQKALEAHRQALTLRAELVREQPADPAARRDLGRTYLALAELLDSLSRVDEARAELVRARGVLVPLARKWPGDGGTRWLEAECDSLDGRLLVGAGMPAEGRSSLERARALYKGLIRDNPPYTLPTAADGPTEYRRGLAKALVRIGETYHEESRHDEVLRTMEKLRAVSEELVSGRFADDMDRQRLGLSYQTTGWALNFFRPPAEAIHASERALAIYRQLADANPPVTAYKIALASCLSEIGFIYLRRDVAKARKYALEAISVIRSLSPEQTVETGLVEVLCERILGSYDLAGGRIDEALLHMKRGVSAIEGAARAHPDYLQYQEEWGGALVWLAVTELIVGDRKGAVRTGRRIRNLVETVLREYPELRFAWNWKIAGLLIEAYVDVMAGRLSEASQLAERAAAGFQVLKPPLSNQEHFFRGAVEALFFAAGRPFGDDRPTEPPGLRQHAERAIADVWEADRMGYQLSTHTVMVDKLLGGRPELQLLLMDQVFPEDPFQPEPGADNDEPKFNARGTKP